MMDESKRDKEEEQEEMEAEENTAEVEDIKRAAEQIDVLREDVEAAITLRVRQIRKKAEREFKEWKRALTEMIRTGSTLQFNEHTGDYQFILPTRLVKLVWSTTVKERVKLEKVKGAEGALRRATESLRDEVDGAVEGVMGKAEEAQAEVVDINVKLVPLDAGSALPEGMTTEEAADEEPVVEAEPAPRPDGGSAEEDHGQR